MFLVQAQTEFGVRSRGAATAADVLVILDEIGDPVLDVIVQDEDGRIYERAELERLADDGAK